MKKIFKCFLVLSLLCFGFSSNFSVHAANEDLVKAGPQPVTVNVNTTKNVRLMYNGSYGNASFKITGTYTTIMMNGSKVAVSHNLKATLVDYTYDWDFYLDKVTYELHNDHVDVKLNYHFRGSYLDTPITGGYQYNATTLEIY